MMTKMKININNKINIIKTMMIINKINKMKIIMEEGMIMITENNYKISTLTMMSITEVLANLEEEVRNNKCRS